MTVIQDNQPLSPALAIHRLEFGKYCQSDGSVEEDASRGLAEHCQLGHSPDFPPELVRFCAPSIVGLQTREAAEIPADWRHGTLLRPVYPSPTQPFTLLCRIAQRAERRAAPQGRRYTIARYLAMEGSPVTPFTLWRTLDAAPLQGLTRTEAQSLRTLAAETAVNLPARPAADAQNFCRTALTYLFSGVPLSCSGPLTEADLFGYAGQLWGLLPAWLRPHLSVGWQTGNHLAGRLALSYTQNGSPLCADFNAATGQWQQPAQMLVWNRQGVPEPQPFATEYLAPGQAYMDFLDRQAADDGSWPDGDLIFLQLELPQLKKFRVRELPDWFTATTVHSFRYVGFSIADYFRLTDLDEYLKRAVGPSPAPVLALNSLRYAENKEQAWRKLLTALAAPETAAHAETIWWHTLATATTENYWPDKPQTDDTPLGSRLRLFAALRPAGLVPVAHILHELLQTARHNMADDLPPPVAEALTAALGRSLHDTDTTVWQQHAALLQEDGPPLPEVYRAWASKNRADLMSAVELADLKIYHRIYDLDASLPVLRVLLKLRETSELDAAMQDLWETLTPDNQQQIADVWQQEWERRTADKDAARRATDQDAARRERLLTWLKCLPRSETSDGLLRLAQNLPLDATQIAGLENDIKNNRVPPSLRSALACLALEHWTLLGTHAFDNQKEWREITAFWPPTLERVLLRLTETRPTPATDSISPEMQQILTAIKIPCAELDAMWTQCRRAAVGKQTGAPLIWWLASQTNLTNDAHPTVSELCQYLTKGAWPSDATGQHRDAAFTPEQLTSFIELAKYAKPDSVAQDQAQQLWANARYGWQRMILLGTFQEIPFRLVPNSLSSLVRFGTWAREHARQCQIHQDFALAGCGFQSQPYTNEWEPVIAQETIVWAVFYNIPPMLLKKCGYSLVTTIDAYQARNPSNISQLEDVAMCRKFLAPYLSARMVPADKQNVCDLAENFVEHRLLHRGKLLSRHEINQLRQSITYNLQKGFPQHFSDAYPYHALLHDVLKFRLQH